MVKKTHHIFSSQPRADQMPGSPREGQLMCTLFLDMHQQTERTNDVILSHEQKHGMTVKVKPV